MERFRLRTSPSAPGPTRSLAECPVFKALIQKQTVAKPPISDNEQLARDVRF
jgi:hypothetical protein